jgi:hypothetical protein
MLFVVGTSPGACAGRPTTTAYAILFGSDTATIGRIVVQRESPWRQSKDRVTTQMFDAGTADAGDASASIADARLVDRFMEQLRKTPASEGCYNANFSAQTLPVSWAVFFYKNAGDQHRQAALYITKDGLCASDGSALYFIYPELSVYLERTFSFMNF